MNKSINMSPVRTAAEKEAQIMNEIRSSAVKFEPKFEGSILGELFGFSRRARTT